MDDPIDSIRLVLPVCGWRTNPGGELSGIRDSINLMLEGRSVGTMTVTVAKPRITQEEPSEDQDEHRRKRIAKWLRDRYDSGGSFEDTPELLLDFEKFLAECEAERQRA